MEFSGNLPLQPKRTTTPTTSRRGLQCFDKANAVTLYCYIMLKSDAFGCASLHSGQDEPSSQLCPARRRHYVGELRTVLAECLVLRLACKAIRPETVGTGKPACGSLCRVIATEASPDSVESECQKQPPSTTCTRSTKRYVSALVSAVSAWFMLFFRTALDRIVLPQS